MKLVSFHWFWMVFLLVVGLIMWAPLPFGYAKPAERILRIEASRFQYSPSILKVNPDDRVTIELVSQDVVHGLSIDGYDLSLSADPGQTAHLTFTADKAGSFRFRCIVPCGNLHPFMIGKLEVGPNLLFLRGIGLALLSLLAGIWRFWR